MASRPAGENTPPEARVHGAGPAKVKGAGAMARGFLTGVIWGTVVAGIGAGTLSQLSEMPVRAVAPSETAPYPAPTGERPEAAAPAPQDPAKPGRLPAPEVAVDAPEGEPEAPPVPPRPVESGVDTAPPKAPEIGAAPDAPEGAAPADEGAGIAVATDAPVLPVDQGQAPDAPEPEAEPDISLDPAQPPLPPVPDGDSALAPEIAPEGVEPAEQPEVAPAEPDRVAEADAEPAPELNAEPEPEPRVTVRPSVTEPEDAPAEDGVRIGRPAGSLLDRTPAVPEGRLPRIGAEEPDAEPVAEPTPDSPLLRFAAPVEVAADVPRMAIVLVDDGTQVMGPDAFDAFPFPVSFAITPDHPDPAGAQAAYRDLGFEVLAMASLPAGARPSDVEVTLSGTLAQLTEAVAVIEDPEASLQPSKEVSDQVTSVLSESGHGVVMMPKGLNTAQKLALKAGVPSATLFRDLDSEGQDSTVIRRTLDQAAFRARQEGAVIMLGRLRPDTISALLLWGLQDRSGAIALVPVSTVLIESAGQ